jgi:hypothetical protein
MNVRKASLAIAARLAALCCIASSYRRRASRRTRPFRAATSTFPARYPMQQKGRLVLFIPRSRGECFVPLGIFRT